MSWRKWFQVVLVASLLSVVTSQTQTHWNATENDPRNTTVGSDVMIKFSYDVSGTITNGSLSLKFSYMSNNYSFGVDCNGSFVGNYSYDVSLNVNFPVNVTFPVNSSCFGTKIILEINPSNSV